mgnify:CR=1 FL=1
MQRYESEAFARETACSGPLGAAYTPEATTFRLWTPLAEAVSVNLYPHGNGGGRPEVHPMERDAQGVWSITLPGDQNGRYYTYTVQIDGKTQETGDPLCRGSGCERPAQHGPGPGCRRARRVAGRPAAGHPAPETGGLGGERPRFLAGCRQRCRPDWRGSFWPSPSPAPPCAGHGTHPTCLNYLQQLGVGYVQIMPMYDFGSVDEAKAADETIQLGL